jgi:diketogulonate reductase-like aldo/keto reductase
MSKPLEPRLSRREAIRAGLLAGAGALLARHGHTQATETAGALITKPIPSSGERLPAIGLGTDSFRRGLEDVIRNEIGRMVELGGTVVDTSSDYGASEELIGDALSSLGIRKRVFLATKLMESGGFFGGVSGKASFELSLQRLRTQQVDLLQVHNLDGTDKFVPMMQEWKKAGTIRYLGVTTSRVGQHRELMDAMHKHTLDFIQVNYSIGDRAAARDVLPLAAERRMAVLINVPFGRSSLFRRIGSTPLPSWAADFGIDSWAQYMLKYVISHPAVTCAIPGSTELKHLVDNQGAGRGRLPDAPTREKMERYWDSKIA